MAQVNVRNRKKADGSNNWEYRFESASIDGKRKQVSKSGFKTKKEALEAGNKALAEYNRSGLHFEPSEMSVSDYLDYWFENYVKVNCKYNTQLDYERVIRLHIKPYLGAYKLKSLSTHICQMWINKKYTNGGLSKVTLKGIQAVLSGAMSYAVEPAKLIQASPMDHVKFPKMDDTKCSYRNVIPAEHMELIFDRFRGTPYYYAIMIGYYTGMRISEVYGLTWDDIDLDNGYIDINKQVVKRNFEVDIKKKHEKQERSAWYFQTPKTKSSIRRIKIGNTLIKALKEYRKSQLENEMLYGEYYINQYLKEEKDEKGQTVQRIINAEKTILCGLPKVNIVFRKESGEYSSTDSFKYASRVIHHELGLVFNFHSLRHTHATKLIESGVSIKAVQTRLGHENIQTTLQTYAHTTEDMESYAVESFEKIMSTG